MVPQLSYNPVMKRFLIAYTSDDVVGDYEEVSDYWGAKDIRGTIYGAPSFVSGRVIEKGSGNPVEGARVIVIGAGFLEKMTTNIGGWWNIPKESQRNGRYFIIVLNGFRIAIQSVTYEDEPLRTTIEVKSR